MGVTAKQRALKAARAAKAVRPEMSCVITRERWATIETAARIVRTLGEEQYVPRLHLCRAWPMHHAATVRCRRERPAPLPIFAECNALQRFCWCVAHPVRSIYKPFTASLPHLLGR